MSKPCWLYARPLDALSIFLFLFFNLLGLLAVLTHSWCCFSTAIFFFITPNGNPASTLPGDSLLM